MSTPRPPKSVASLGTRLKQTAALGGNHSNERNGARHRLTDYRAHFNPGGPGYDEMLPIARENPQRLNEPADPPVDPDTLARILRATGLNESDLSD